MTTEERARLLDDARGWIDADRGSTDDVPARFYRWAEGGISLVARLVSALEVQEPSRLTPGDRMRVIRNVFESGGPDA